MNIKAGLCRQLPGLEAALAHGVPGGCPLVCPLLLHRVLSLLVTSLERGQQPWFGRGGTRVVPTCTHVLYVCAHPPLSVLVCHPPASWCCLRPPTGAHPCLLLGTQEGVPVPVPRLHPWGHRGRWHRWGAAITQARPRGSRCSVRWHRTCPRWLGTAGGCLGTGGGCLGTAGCRAWRRLPDSSFITAASPGHGGKARLVLNWKINLDSYTSTAPALAPGGKPSSLHRSCAPAGLQHPQDGETEAGRRAGAGGSRASVPSRLLCRALCYCFIRRPYRSALPGRLRACLFIYLRHQPRLISAGGGGRPPQTD